MNKIDKKTYKKILELMPIVCVDLVIVNNGRILLLKRKNEPAKGEWFVPGGRIFKNETLISAVKRKAIEETGLNIRIIKPLIFEETFFNKPSITGVKTGAHAISLSYLVESESDNVKLDEQSEDYIWIDHTIESLHPLVRKLIQLSGILKNGI